MLSRRTFSQLGDKSEPRKRKSKDPKSDPLGVVVVGLGSRGKALLEILSETKDIEVIGVVDPVREAPDGTTKFQSLQDALSNDVDAVFISSPDQFHASQCLEALNSGAHVYLEKPMFRSPIEADTVLTALEKTGKLLHVGVQQRALKESQEAIEIIRSGEIGRVTLVEMWVRSLDALKRFEDPKGWIGSGPIDPKFADERFRWFYSHGGGKVTDWGYHLMDVVQWAMGPCWPTAISGCAAKHRITDCGTTPDTASVTWEFQSFMATLTVCQGGRGSKDHGVVFRGDLASLELGRWGWEITPERDDSWNPLVPQRSSSSKFDRKNDTAWIDEFITGIREGRSGLVPDSSLETDVSLMLANAAIKSGRRIIWDPASKSCVGDRLSQSILEFPR